MSDVEHAPITSDPKVMMGKPVLAGTRITVEHILRELAAGTTIAELLDMHPHITRDGIMAALEYADELP
ncbi:MAG TPA: DUF433 domain-containing protein [Ktedonobacterales bacterium]|jgi:uncharacterized protein (DUF433 family)|nr:DUF433 domain-containing protein [Ktedonobacterales bacterium]